MDGYGTTVPVSIATLRKQSSKASIAQWEKSLRLVGELSTTGLLNATVSTRSLPGAFIVPTFTIDRGSCRLRRPKSLSTQWRGHLTGRVARIAPIAAFLKIKELPRRRPLAILTW